MNARKKSVVVALTVVALGAGGTVAGSPAQAHRAHRAHRTTVSVHQFDDIGYIVAYRKAQMAHDYVANAAHLAG